jgi:glucose/arabinose dehydrogenase
MPNHTPIRSLIAAGPLIALAWATFAPTPTRAADLPTGVQCKLFYDTSAIHYAGPVWFGEFPGTRGTFLVGETAGGLHLLEPDGAGFKTGKFGQIPTEAFQGNDGLLGLAFHPDFRTNRKYYVYYILVRGTGVLEERQATADFRGDAGTSRILLRNVFKNVVHNGGDMHFGTDGYLYLGLGDAGNPNVYNTRGQDLSLYAGKMLRIDVDRKDAGLEYSIPADNPFVKDPDPFLKKEIYAYGLRQPWRWSFDPLDGRLVEGEVGDWVQEEVNIVRKGGNYGWSVMEGNTCFNGADEISPLDHCDDAGLTPPIAVIPHVPVSTAPTACIIGGYVFRGDAASAFYGAYVFGDWETRRLYGLKIGAGAAGEGTGGAVQIGTAPEGMSTFGTDSQGNLYVAGFNSGVIRRLDHPGLIGKGVAIRRVEASPIARSPRRIGRLGDGWRIEAGSFPMGTALSILGMNGRVLKRFGAEELAAGVDLDLPQGLYVGRSLVRERAGAFPIVLR